MTFNLMRIVQGGLLRTGPPGTFFATSCVLKATKPMSWTHAVLKAKNLEMVIRHPTDYDLHQTFHVTLTPQTDGHIALTVNDQIVHAAENLYSFKLVLFGDQVGHISDPITTPVHMLYDTKKQPFDVTMLRN
jgi:hypothetical protein